MRETWTDFRGVEWPVLQTSRRLKFKYPAHAALRAHVFHRDLYACVRCGADAIDVPMPYTGRQTLFTNTLTGAGTQDVLIVDHIVTLSAGGENRIENMQALCETCNRKKQPEDRAAASAYRGL